LTTARERSRTRHDHGLRHAAKERPPVAVTEVGTRDGFQAEKRFIDTAVKAEIIDAMIAAGVRRIEATSFVSPRAVPQLADAHDVLSRLTRRKDAHIAALVPNARGAERALGAGVDEAVCFVSASETHNRTNLNTSIGDALANVAEVAKIVRGNARMRGAVACAFGCPFEGEVPVAAAMRVIDRYAELASTRSRSAIRRAWRRLAPSRSSSKRSASAIPKCRLPCISTTRAASGSRT
jgi:hydroxymethylglutaryl-CoA lyase